MMCYYLNVHCQGQRVTISVRQLFSVPNTCRVRELSTSYYLSVLTVDRNSVFTEKVWSYFQHSFFFLRNFTAFKELSTRPDYLCCTLLLTHQHVDLTRSRISLRHCATSAKIAGSIPDGVTGTFH